MVAVELRADAPVDVGELAPLIAIRPGAPLDEESVRRTLLRLRLAGVGSELEVRARDVPGGVVAVVALYADLRVDAVELEGELGLDEKTLRAAVPQRPGQPLREDRVLRGVYRLEEELAAQGYFEARATLAVRVDPATRHATVAYRIAAGPRWTVGAVRLEGVDGGPLEADARKALRAAPGTPYRTATVRGEEDRLQRALVRSGRRLATVRALPEVRDDARRQVDLAYRIEPGPRFLLEVVGADRAVLEKRGLLPFLGGGYDEALRLQTVALIRSYFQERGHYRVEVRAEETRDEETLRLRLEVVPGPKLTLETVAFEGNASFPAERLAQLMTTSPRRLLLPKSGRLVDEELAADLANLRSFYALSGFGAARVGPARVTAAGEDLALTIPVVEGPRQQVGTLAFAGVTALDRAALARRLPLAPGGPFHRVLLDEALAAVRAAYEEAGHRAAIVSADVEWNAEHTLAAVTLRVIEGDSTRVEAVVLRGNTRTRTDVVRRFVELEPGDPVSTARLLQVQRRLYGLGLFSRVDVTTPARGGGEGGGEVLVDVEEGRTRSASYGAGYDSESGARGVLRLSERNLFGRAFSLQLELLAAQRDQIYRLTYLQPYLGRFPLELRSSVYREAEDRPSFDVQRRGFQASVQRTFASLAIWLAYDYRIVELERFDERAEIPRESLDARVASLAPTFLYDRRDDPIDPRRGWSANGQIEFAAPVFDATADFVKLFGQVTGAVDLRRWGSLAASGRVGAIHNRKAIDDPSLEPIDQVPVAERFFAGGRTTHRAFARDELGVPGETLLVNGREDVTALGGGALLLGNFEWRFPIAGPVGGTLFTDVGQVWKELGDVDARQLRWGAGVGVRYRSPIGPIRMEIGWKLDREPFEAPYVWYFSLGNPF